MTTVPDAWTAVDTPALVYDERRLRGTAADLWASSQRCGGVAAYSVKANRHPRLLAAFADAGFGADVASAAEYALAREAGLSPVYATSPGLDAATIVAVDRSGGTVYFDSLEQVQAAASAGVALGRHGIRLALPGDYSAFGFAVPEETDRLSQFGFHPTRLHVHAGEIVDCERLAARLRTVEPYVLGFSAQEVDFGGGFGVLSNDPAELAKAFDLLGGFRTRLGVRWVFEFGKVAVARCGRLVTRVLAVKRRGRLQVVVLDASAFNLGTWETRRVLWTTGGGAQTVPTRLIGPTCYEGDVFLETSLPELREGDRLVLGPTGAYNASIAAGLHGLPLPTEIFIS